MTLDELIADCTACGLHAGCQRKVPGEGKVPTNLMFVGEGPGEVEDNTGRPFVGPAGQLLDKIIAGIGWKRGDIFITNIIKCRPPENRTPHVDEVAACKPYLDAQIEAIKPKVIVCWGSPAASTLIHPRFQITKEHGIWFDYKPGIKAVALFHPAYLLRLETSDPEKCLEAKKMVWDSIRKINEYLKRS